MKWMQNIFYGVCVYKLYNALNGFLLFTCFHWLYELFQK